MPCWPRRAAASPPSTGGLSSTARWKRNSPTRSSLRGAQRSSALVEAGAPPYASPGDVEGRMKILSFLCAAALALSATAATAKERTVVVVLFDGFSPASLDATRTPNFDRIKKDGAWSRHLVPAFPTIS